MKFKLRRLLPIAAALGMTIPVQATPALWEVRDGDSSIWLFGSFHIIPEGTQWRSGLFDEILEKADAVVFETDIRPAAAAQMSAEAFLRGIYTDGTLLTDTMDDALEAALRETAADIGLPIGAIQAMRPWMATNTISVQALAAGGFNTEGVEFQLQPDLPDERLAFLETGAEQLEVLAGAPEDEQVAMLEATLDQMHLLPKMMDKMVRNWTGGTPERLGQLFLMEMGGFEVAYLERLIYERNRNWIPQLEEMLAEGQENLVIVGAAHLIGDDSVLDLLEQEGFTVERVQ